MSKMRTDVTWMLIWIDENIEHLERGASYAKAWGFKDTLSRARMNLKILRAIRSLIEKYGPEPGKEKEEKP